MKIKWLYAAPSKRGNMARSRRHRRGPEMRNGGRHRCQPPLIRFRKFRHSSHHPRLVWLSPALPRMTDILSSPPGPAVDRSAPLRGPASPEMPFILRLAAVLQPSLTCCLVCISSLLWLATLRGNRRLPSAGYRSQLCYVPCHCQAPDLAVLRRLAAGSLLTASDD